MRPTLRHVLLLAPLALLAPTARAATPAAAAAPAAPATGTLQLGKGDVVTIDLSKLPARVSRRGTATCVALVAVPDQRPQEKRCDQPFAFEVPLAGPPMLASRYWATVRPPAVLLTNGDMASGAAELEKVQSAGDSALPLQGNCISTALADA